MRTTKIIGIFFLCIFFSNAWAQHGGVGLKISNPYYQFDTHPGYKKIMNSLYLSLRISQNMTIFIDSYLFRDEGDAFDTGLSNQPIPGSSFSDKATVIGPMYYYNPDFSGLIPYFGLGFGWHSLLIGDKELNPKESSKNYGGHAVLGVSYDLKKIPVVAFVEGRYARIFLSDEDADPKFIPSALHQGGSIQITSLAFGFLIYFF